MDTSAHSDPSSPQAVKRARGFSLVEVTIALGIMAFGFVTLFGMIPTGLNVLRQAMDATVCASIIQRVMNDAQQADFSALTLAANSDKIRYFSDQGDDVTPTSGVPDARAIYEVHTIITPTTTLPAGTSLVNLATVTIQIVTNPGHRTPVTNTTTKLWKDPSFTITSYSGYVSQAR